MSWRVKRNEHICRNQEQKVMKLGLELIEAKERGGGDAAGGGWVDVYGCVRRFDERGKGR